MLGLSKLGMFLYDLQQKFMFDAHQIAVKQWFLYPAQDIETVVLVIRVS